MHTFFLNPYPARLTYKHELRKRKHLKQYFSVPIRAYFEVHAHVGFLAPKNAFSGLYSPGGGFCSHLLQKLLSLQKPATSRLSRVVCGENPRTVPNTLDMETHAQATSS